MADGTVWDDRIWDPNADTTFPHSTTAKSLDRTLGTILVLCSVIGIPGNILALRYFWSTKRADLATLLYIAITFFDIISCIVRLPVAAVLFIERSPGIFQFTIACGIYRVVYRIGQRISLFLVMLLSVSRTIAIVNPFYQLNKRAMLVASLIILGLQAGNEISLFFFGFRYFYVTTTAYCYIVSIIYPMDLFAIIQESVYCIRVGAPSAISFISFCICLLKLSNSGLSQTRSTNRRASTTITIFTGIFLLCNLPFFVSDILYIITLHGYTYPGPFYNNTFMYWYSWIVFKVVSVVLNSTLNPILYFCRMSRFRAWIKNAFGTQTLPRCRSQTIPLSSYSNPATSSRTIVQGTGYARR